jgi:radical SAM protein with 4Fe4S-binding SPASM domain
MRSLTNEAGIPADSLRLKNRETNLAEFEQREVELSSLPRVLFIELTENCNLSCSMCRSAGPFDRTRNMPSELFDRVADELFPTAEIVDLRGWGESTILKDFPAYVDKTLDYGCRIRLISNLTVPNEDLWRKLVRSGSLIGVSFDAADAETFATLRRGAKLSTILQNLETIADEGRRSGVGTDNVHLNVVVQSAAIKELPDIVRIASGLGLSVHLNPVFLDDTDPDALRYHVTELAEILGVTADTAVAENVKVQLDTSLDFAWSQPEHANKTCTHPWMYCYVNYKGEVGFCDHLIGIPGKKYLFGDLSQESFTDIWNGPSYRQLRAEHAAGKLSLSDRFEECRWCYENRYVDFEQETYPPYEKHRMLLSRAACPTFVPIVPPPPRKNLSLITGVNPKRSE